MPALPKWAQFGGFIVWAPEVMKIGDKYVMYYTAARQDLQPAVRRAWPTYDKPDGNSWIPTHSPSYARQTWAAAIDASAFRDGDKLYLYFKNDGNCCNNHYLYAQELAPDGLSLVGEPTQLIKNEHSWEGAVVEAPTMWKHDGKYYLFFSANNYAGFDYAVGYATCNSPTGPCEQAAENPILQSHRTLPLVIGPGHQSIIEVNGKDRLIYYAWEVTSAGTRGNRRFMSMNQLEWKDGKPTVNGPTIGPQAIP